MSIELVYMILESKPVNDVYMIMCRCCNTNLIKGTKFCRVCKVENPTD